MHESIGSGIAIYSGLFQITPVSILLESFLLIIGGLILVSWPITIVKKYSPLSEKISEDYSLIVLFSSLGSSLLISSFDLISLYISIELQSFGLYVLATLYRDSETSTKAGLKYFLLGGLSSCIILLGCGLIYAYTGLTNFESLYSIISTSNVIFDINQGLNLGLILIFIGFLFKIAAAPLHNWSPDVYDEVPTIVTTWLTIIPKISILVVLLELQYYGFTLISTDITNNMVNIAPSLTTNSSIIKLLLLVSSVLSLLIGTFVGLAQTRIKRLLAYSTISHIGFILLALAINSEYTITNLNIFLIILALSYVAITSNYSLSIQKIDMQIRDIRYIRELSGKFLINPILTISLAICLFSMAGIPPLIGFFSKQFVLYSAIQNGYYFISLIAISVSVISASYYIKIVKVLYSGENDYNIQPLSEEDSKTVLAQLDNSSNTTGTNQLLLLSNLHSYLISVLTLSILFFILKPSLILNSTQVLSLSLFNC